MHSVVANNLVSMYTCVVLLSLLGEICGQCVLNPDLIQDDKRNSNRGQNLLDKLNRLSTAFRNHPVEAQGSHKTYTMKFCPDDRVINNHSAFDEKDSRTIRSLGRINDSDAMISDLGDTLYLIYKGGESGDHHVNVCDKAERRTITAIRMTSAVEVPTLFPTEESVSDGGDFCYYMFKLYYPLNSEIGSVISVISMISM